MNKKQISLLIIVIAIALVGLISVQVNWITNAYEVQEQQFNQLINKSLTEIVKRVEEHETVASISKETTSFSSETEKIKIKPIEENSIIDSIVENQRNPEVYVYSNDSIIYKIDKNLSDSLYTEKKVSKEELKANIINKIAKKTIFVENIVNKLIRKEINVKERINKKILNSIIKKEFSNKGIDLNYEFTIDSDNEHSKTQTFEYNYSGKIYEILLFPNDILSSNSYLKIYFPNQQKSIWESLPTMALSSIIFTLTIIVIFFVTINIIYNQKKLSEMKNDFINNMTHELKTPISTISLATQMLRDNSIPIENKNVDNISSIISDESKRLESQVEKVLQMATIEKGGIKLKLNLIDINLLIPKICKNFEIKIKDKNGILEKNLNANISIVLCDETHILNVITNLIDNAIKYSEKEPHIKITTETNNNYITISVIDNGIGIKKENQKKIFDKFYRVPTGNLHNVKGFGLGLSYVKKIVEKHMGEVKIKSSLAKGSNFIISLPLKK